MKIEDGSIFVNLEEIAPKEIARQVCNFEQERQIGEAHKLAYKITAEAIKNKNNLDLGEYNCIHPSLCQTMDRNDPNGKAVLECHLSADEGSAAFYLLKATTEVLSRSEKKKLSLLAEAEWNDRQASSLIFQVNNFRSEAYKTRPHAHQREVLEEFSCLRDEERKAEEFNKKAQGLREGANYL